jgi:large subunit ribosomal protein L7/L12
MTAPSGITLVITDTGTNKIQVIKEVREITRLGLKEAKDLVDGVDRSPQVVAAGLESATARQWAQQLANAGATAEVRTYT